MKKAKGRCANAHKRRITAFCERVRKMKVRKERDINRTKQKEREREKEIETMRTCERG